MLRLYSTFANGWPGFGLLLIRAMLGLALEGYSTASLRSDLSIGQASFFCAFAACGLLILIGLWTPVAGTLAALMEGWQAFNADEGSGQYLLLGTVAAALAMLGPGFWSIDAHLFGWKRIQSQTRKNVSKPS